MSIRLLIADDHPVITDGLVHLFEIDGGFELVGRYANGADALEAIRKLRPDVALLDLRMPGISGLDVLRSLQKDASSTRVVFLTAEITDDEALEAVRLGVRGIVLKGSPSRELIQAVKTVAAGKECIDAATIKRALDHTLRREAGAAEVGKVLTKREIELVKCVASGMRNRDIAEQLNIAEATVKIHLHSIYQKLGLSGRVELTIYARERAMV